MLSLHEAQKLVTRAIEAGTAQQVPVAVVVVDPGGHIIAAARMEGAGFLSLKTAHKKARTAAGMGFPTEAIAHMAAEDPLIGEALHGDPDFFILPGGIPIVKDGRAMGAIGVAGGIYHQDQAVATAALAHVFAPFPQSQDA
ncbi:GlcG/HbpS family heme-binding protein [Govanella unica]|uniref:Heme-binding protein n=1 Tax=Govanella unica TaxID=2975056 RepID=A0A9X3TW71_9PROT|nr:heme-binding protein [Govania unica]MDA5192562.1 heme-binding protein [Govania unica]